MKSEQLIYRENWNMCAAQEKFEQEKKSNMQNKLI